MGNIKVKNRTTLTDFSALIRVGLYLAGEVDQATENGFSFQVNGSEVGTIVTITETKKVREKQMAATRLCRDDAGRLIDAMKDVSSLLENLGVEDGNMVFSANGDIFGLFTADGNKLNIDVTNDGKKESVAYDK